VDNHKPSVSIGLPIYNGENYLEKALKAILAQTYSDFELIISDNASTDRTQEICLAYAAKDRRIHYYRNKNNFGAAKNFNRVFKISSGKYFKWAAHDDLLAPDYLLKCVEVLDHNSSVVLCFPHVKIINSQDQEINNFSIDLKKLQSPEPSERFGCLIETDLWCYEIFGLIRANRLGKTSLFTSHFASDRALLAELGLMGRFQEISESLFYIRDHPERSIRSMPAHHMRAAWMDPNNVRRIVFPHWRIWYEYYKSVKRASLGNHQRRKCYYHLIHWPMMNKNWVWMILDLILVILPFSWKFFFKFRKPTA
jgi:glycosyltransferase involved in cell wall biosynthesis